MIDELLVHQRAMEVDAACRHCAEFDVTAQHGFLQIVEAMENPSLDGLIHHHPRRNI